MFSKPVYFKLCGQELSINMFCTPKTKDEDILKRAKDLINDTELTLNQ